MAQKSPRIASREFPGQKNRIYVSVMVMVIVVYQAPPLSNEGRDWTAKDDDELHRLAKFYDVNFGGIFYVLIIINLYH